MMLVTIREFFILFSGGGLFSGMLIWLGVMLHMANTKVDEMLEHLQK